MINFKNPCLDTLYKTEKPKTPQTKIQRKRKFQDQRKKQNKTRLSSKELDSHLTPL